MVQIQLVNQLPLFTSVAPALKLRSRLRRAFSIQIGPFGDHPLYSWLALFLDYLILPALCIASPNDAVTVRRKGDPCGLECQHRDNRSAAAATMEARRSNEQC
jgi:hypothetical protein